MAAGGEQSHHRHGHQPGYVIFHGRKIPIQRPRLRQKGGAEATLESYPCFQPNAARRGPELLRQVSTRDYAGALEDCLEGYGIQKSSVSRHWKAAT